MFGAIRQPTRCAISYEERMNWQKSMGIGVAECSKQTIENEPVFAVGKASKRECFRCGARNFHIEHTKKCTAANHKCEHSKFTKQFLKML